jgi:hypothetical protein
MVQQVARQRGRDAIVGRVLNTYAELGHDPIVDKLARGREDGGRASVRELRSLASGRPLERLYHPASAFSPSLSLAGNHASGILWASHKKIA